MAANRRSWSKPEEKVLIAAMKEEIANGFKCDNGYRAGYLVRVEEAIKKVFPSTDLRGNPHVNSKLTCWKKSYYSLQGILSRSGIGFNLKGNFMIDCEDEQWDHVIKADPNAKTMRYKSWPYYDHWVQIFGKDRANGDIAEDVLDGYNQMKDEDDMSNNRGNRVDSNVSLEELQESEGVADSVCHSNKSRDAPNSKPKKRKMATETSEIKQVLTEIGRKTNERLATLAEGIAYEAELGKARKGAFKKLEDIPNLTIDDRFAVCEILGQEQDKLEVYMGLPDSAIPMYVQRLLRNKGPSTSGH